MTGLKDDVSTIGGSTSDSASSTSTPEDKPTVVTQAGKTIIVTAPSQTDAAEGHAGSNKAGIAAGVVVGVVGACLIAGGLIFFFRQKRKKAVEDEYRRNAAAVNSFIAGGKPMSSSSMSDSRFDGDFMAQRRQSNGSIADDQDFSRRILKASVEGIGRS